MPKTRFAVLAAALALASSVHAADTYTFDKSHTNVGFQVRHIFTNVSGKFTDFAGTIQIDRAKPEASTVDFTIQATSIDTSEPRRDQHLRSADFFDAENHPSLTFSVDGITLSGGGARVTGTLTVRDRTRPLSFDAQVSAFDGAEVWLDAEVKVNRADFGLTWNQLGMASMDNVITIHAVFSRP
jgi:polyisoprenoid-binding protein YceI